MIRIKKRSLQLFSWMLALATIAGLLYGLPGSEAARAADEGDVAGIQRQADPASEVQVDPELLAEFDQKGSAGYLIYFREKADLSAAYDMDWEARGQYVIEALQAAADRTQQGVRTYLKSNQVPHQTFWIDNVIAVESSDQAVFNGLLAFSEIAVLRAEPVVGLIEPIETQASPASLQVAEPNLTHVQAPDVWALGFEGQGMVVANIDTGVRYTHEALEPQYRGNLGGGSFNHNYNWYDPYGTYASNPDDGNGHGSHTMGTMIGDDGATNEIGMAPSADWIACRGCSGLGCGGAELLSCAQFIAAPTDLTGSNPDPNQRPHVVNNSWGDCSQSYDSWYQGVVDSWHAAGVYPVFSNGNASNCGYLSPPGLNTVGNPARYGNVTGVGSTGTSNGQYANHSNWGPTDNLDTVNPNGYPTIKPQVAAPGVSIRSSYATGDTSYASLTGTSMSAPHVAGLIALMWQAAPCLEGDYAATETIMQNSATPIPYATNNGDEGPGDVPNHATGWGEINALAAIQAAQASCGPFSLVVTPTAQDVCAPSDALYDVDVTQNKAGFTDPVTLSVQGEPAGTTTGFSANPVVPPGSSTLTIGNTGSAAGGDYTLDVIGTAPTATYTATVSLGLSAGAPSAPGLIAPANGASGVSVRPNFQWSAVAGAQNYLLEVATDNAFNNLVYTATLATTAHMAGSSLTGSTQHYWRVTASNACGDGSSSSTFTFTTADIYCSTPSLAIPDSSSTTDSIVIPGGAPLTDLDVTLNVSHTWVGDLEFSLEHQDTGTTVTILDRPGHPATLFGCSANDIEAALNDEGVDGDAETTCNAIAPALSGDLVGGDPPSTSLLAAFDGESLGGNWVLQVTDNAGGDTGTLNEWCLVPGGSPSIAVDPTEVESFQATDTIITQTLEIENVGTGLLNWQIVESGALASTAGDTDAAGHTLGIDPAALPETAPAGAGCVASPISWLSVDPENGSTLAGAASLVDLIFDSTGLAGGVYTGSVCIDSNDLVNPSLTVPVTLTVEAAPTYGLDLSPDSSATGSPGAMLAHTLTITNTGNVADIYDLAASGHAWSTSLSTDAVTLNPGASISILVLVEIPSLAAPGSSDAAIITVTSRGDPGTSGTATMTTHAAGMSPLYLPLIIK